MTLASVLIAAAVAANLLLLAGLLRAAGRRRPKSAAAAPDIPASVPSRPLTREEQLCFQRGHAYPDWAKTPRHWVCVRCGDTVARITASSTFDQHAAMALGIANETGIDEVALADFDLWTTENGWAKS